MRVWRSQHGYTDCITRSCAELLSERRFITLNLCKVFRSLLQLGAQQLATLFQFRPLLSLRLPLSHLFEPTLSHLNTRALNLIAGPEKQKTERI